jgi:drug/metabolite transporter (DMT)-like permease
MNPLTLKRISIVGAILTVLIAIDGLYMVFTNYHPDDTSNNGFGSFHPSDGVTVLIAALLLLIVTVIAFALSTRAQPEKEAAIQSEVEPEVKA